METSCFIGHHQQLISYDNRHMYVIYLYGQFLLLNQEGSVLESATQPMRLQICALLKSAFVDICIIEMSNRSSCPAEGSLMKAFITFTSFCCFLCNAQLGEKCSQWKHEVSFLSHIFGSLLIFDLFALG